MSQTTTKATRRSSKAATATNDNDALLFDALAVQPSYDDPNLAAQFPYVAVKHVGGSFHALDMDLSKAIKAPPGKLIATLEELTTIIAAYHVTRGATAPAVTLVPEVTVEPIAPVAEVATTSRRSRRSTTVATGETLPGTIAAPSNPATIGTAFNPVPIAPLPDSTASAVVAMAQAIDARLDTMAEAIAALRVSTDRQFGELADLILTVQAKQENTDQLFTGLREFLAIQQGQTIAKIEALIPTVTIGATIPAPIAATVSIVPEVPAPIGTAIPTEPFIRKNIKTGITTLVIPVTDPACDMDHYLGVIDTIADQTGLALPEDHPTQLNHPEMGALMVLPIANEFYVAMEAGGFPAQAA